jgi:DNA-binding MarR family transcriptional regulator
MKDKLSPTFWRTCRVLTEEHRIACLAAVIEHPGATVDDLAKQNNYSQPVTSVFLRALQARGLLTPVRVSRFVRYYPIPDPLVDSAAPMLKAMTNAFSDEKLPFDQIRRIMTAFTHPRRIKITAILNSCPMDAMTLSAATGISMPAMNRHLDKLSRRGFAVEDPSGKWHIACPESALAHAVLKLVVDE